VLGLADNPPVLDAVFHLRVASQELELKRPVVYRYVDRVRGELTRPLAVVPPVAVEFALPTLVFPATASKQVEVQVRPNIVGASGVVRLSAPGGWQVEPPQREFRATDAGEIASVQFQVTPPMAECIAQLRATASMGDREISTGMQVIAHPHIPPQTVFEPSEARAVRADIRTLARKVGYIMGAGDEVPAMLRQIGIDVTLLTPDELARGDLSRFDAIVTGVRAFNVRPDLRANHQRLLEYVKSGGTLVVEYNVAEGGPFSVDTGALNKIGPYPLRIGRDRVTVEEAPVTFPSPGHPVLHGPNEITARDFEGWVQERGLYFASQWDDHYQSLLESHDPGEKPLPGGMLYARYGKGAYIFTAYSWFRQLPAAVPGAFRIFANLLSAGRTGLQPVPPREPPR
jgi:hypothetical protein